MAKPTKKPKSNPAHPVSDTSPRGTSADIGRLTEIANNQDMTLAYYENQYNNANATLQGLFRTPHDIASDPTDVNTDANQTGTNSITPQDNPAPEKHSNGIFIGIIVAVIVGIALLWRR